jgi:8-oxo-dGTP diphosphatase
MARVRVVVAVIKNNKEQILISLRKKMVPQGGKWEFPGGKIEGCESIESALARELEEELGIVVINSIPLINVTYDYTGLKVRLYARVVEDYSGLAVGREGQKIQWVDKKLLSDYKFPEASEPIIKAIKLARKYAIINSSDIEEVLQQLDKLAIQGIKLVQIRAKALDAQQMDNFLNRLNESCINLGVIYLLNLGAVVNLQNISGLHLSSQQLMALTEKPIHNGYIAASCHNLEELQKAEHLNLDFVVLSPIKETSSHLGAKLLGWELFSQLVEQINIPVYALGGLNKSDYNQAINLFAQGISGIGLFK